MQYAWSKPFILSQLFSYKLNIYGSNRQYDSFDSKQNFFRFVAELRDNSFNTLEYSNTKLLKNLKKMQATKWINHNCFIPLDHSCAVENRTKKRAPKMFEQKSHLEVVSVEVH